MGSVPLAWSASIESQAVDHFVRDRLQNTPIALLSYIPMDWLLSELIADVINFTQRPVAELNKANFDKSIRLLRKRVIFGNQEYAEYLPALSADELISSRNPHEYLEWKRTLHLSMHWDTRRFRSFMRQIFLHMCA